LVYSARTGQAIKSNPHRHACSCRKNKSAAGLFPIAFFAMSLISLDDPTDGSLRRLQAGYRQLFERYPLPMLVVDRATLRLLAANDAAAHCYG
jgi:hypothetical protein